MKELLEKIASLIDEYDSPEELPEDFNMYDASGGNFDDAYYMGIDHGARILAQEIRAILMDMENETTN